MLGKGDKEGLVPASAETMVELGRYRRERGLSALPARHEDTPLVLPLGKSMKPLTRAALHTIVKDIFAGAAGRLRLRGDEFAGQADVLEQASAHWLRHTAGSHMADGGTDLRTVRDNLRHASLTSTNPHLHTPDEERATAKPRKSTASTGKVSPEPSVTRRRGGIVDHDLGRFPVGMSVSTANPGIDHQPMVVVGQRMAHATPIAGSLERC